MSEIELMEPSANLEDLSEELINDLIEKADLEISFGTPDFYKVFQQLGLLEKKDQTYNVTGIGLLLFGKRPQLLYTNALIRATYKTKNRKGEDIKTIEGPLILQPDKIQSWYEDRMGQQIDRTKVERKALYDYPLVVFREAIINAIVHRDYDIKGAPIYFEINDDAIIIKSPGEPVKPITLDQIQKFNAPSLSRNPKIMYIFDQMKLVEQRGLGFQTIKDLPEKFGLPLPIVNYEAPYMVFKFPRNFDAIKRVSETPNITKLNENQLKGYEWLKVTGEASTRAYSNHFNIGYKTAQRALAKMKELGLVGDNGEDPNSPNFKYVAY